jgi:hypothetical protein
MPRTVRASFRAAAALTAALGAAALPGPATAGDRPAFLVSVGPDYGAGSDRAWREGYATFEYRSAQRIWWELRPLYSFAVSRQGAVLGTAGVHAVFRLGPFDVTPHFGVGLWQDGRGGFDSKELIQFRTGIDAFVPLSATVSVGLGIYHVSNAGLTNRSADLDVVRLSLMWRR